MALLSASIVKPALAAPAVIGLRDTGARTLSFNCYNTGEELKATTYWADGKYIPDALSEINYALRDDRSGEVHPIQPKVLDLIHQIGKKLDTNCHFEMYSGYRSPKTNAMLRRAKIEHLLPQLISLDDLTRLGLLGVQRLFPIAVGQ